MLGILAGLVLVGPGAARAQAASGATGAPSASGGLGTLGTEVPLNSAAAQTYVHSRSSTKGDSDQRLAEGVREAIATNEQAQQALQSNDPQAAGAVKEVLDALSIAHFNLVKGAQESGFPLGEKAEGIVAAVGSMGADSAVLPSSDSEQPAVARADTSADASADDLGSSSEESSGSAGQPPDLEGHASRVGDLARDARDANRYLLASSLEIARKALDSAADAMASVAGASSSSTGSATE